MANAFTPIPLVQEGGVSLVSADYANKIIIPLNAIMSGRVVPIANVGAFYYSANQFILDLSAFDRRMRTVEGAITNINTALTFINSRLDSANITANGSCTGNNITINISLNI